MINKINKYYAQELLEQFLSQLGYYYKGNKSNQKKVKDLFNSLPFFFFNITFQNDLFKIIKKNNISVYLDNNDTMQEFCYLIYKDFSNHYNLIFKTQEEFYSDLKKKLFHTSYFYKEKMKNNIHSYLFFLVLFILIIIYYYFK